MLDDIKSKVIEAAETPDCQTQQKHIFDLRAPDNDQAKGKHSTNEEKDALDFDPSDTGNVLHKLNGFKTRA